MKKVGIIGLGLIGGSMAKDLSERDNYHLIGYDHSQDHSNQALELKLVHECKSFEQLVSTADIVVIATPVDVAEEVLIRVLDLIEGDQIVLDVGSTKLNICKSIESHQKRSSYVACHPLAGTENSGPSAAISNLFRNKKNIVCDKELSSQGALHVAIELFKDLGMKNFFMDSKDHDIHLAYVSHISHVSSFVLSETVLKIEEDQNQIFNLASTGFESTVRLAKSSPRTWSAIFDRNKDNLSRALDQYIEEMKEFKSMVELGDKKGMIAYMESANRIKTVLKAI